LVSATPGAPTAGLPGASIEVPAAADDADKAAAEIIGDGPAEAADDGGADVTAEEPAAGEPETEQSS
ncbi:MAG: hypothetical protein ABFS30_02120, partial [Pseudomonadota bacterium]